MVKGVVTLVFASVLALGTVSTAKAQFVPGHPRVNEVDQRLLNQQRRTDAGVNQGQIGARGEVRDAAVDARVARQLSRDEATHNGHVTRSEYRQLNRELNRNSNRVYAQRHR